MPRRQARTGLDSARRLTRSHVLEPPAGLLRKPTLTLGSTAFSSVSLDGQRGRGLVPQRLKFRDPPIEVSDAFMNVRKVRKRNAPTTAQSMSIHAAVAGVLTRSSHRPGGAFP